MCPHCGALVRVRKSGLTFSHRYEKAECPGSGQNPRNPLADIRPLWNGRPNPHAAAAAALAGR